MTTDTPARFDMVIIGAGLSGIGMACHLARQCPEKRYLILEGRSNLGGTWDLFKYPGIRSDSDMFTLGYNFKPWTQSQFLADGPAILNYIREAAEEHQVLDHIRYNAWVERIEWDSPSATWTIQYADRTSGKTRTVRSCFINSCTGYYNYEHGYEPEFPGREQFKGQLIHPQHWPEDLEYAGKRIIVIGSGATAVTLVPELAEQAAHVTMLQRSPTYMAAVPSKDPLVDQMRKLLPENWVYRINRAQKVAFQASVYQLSRRFPKQIRKLLLSDVRRKVGPEVDMTHFTPRYNPWDERLCAVKSGDLFKAVRNGSVTIVTDHIDHFTETGIQLKSGQHLEADIVITATGLDLKFAGGMDIVVDGKPYDYTQKMNYKGVMFEDLPNLGMTFGYTNASWTLKADLTSEFLCRLMKYMDRKGWQIVRPENHDPNITPGNFLDFQSGYIQRAIDKFPKMGNRMPWKLYQNYPIDLALLRFGRLNDGILQFSRAENSPAPNSGKRSLEKAV